MRVSPRRDFGRGVTLLVCNIAAMNWAARLAQKLERDVEETRNAA